MHDASQDGQGGSNNQNPADDQAMIKSLQQLSMDAIISSSIIQVDASDLQKFSDIDLVELVLALKEKHKKMEDESANVKRNSYVVDPPSVQDRDSNGQETYDLIEAICAKWSVEVAHDRSDVGEQSSQNFSMSHSVKERKHVLSPSPYSQFRRMPGAAVKKHIVNVETPVPLHFHNADYKSVWKVISSANLLYRLCYLFEGLPVDSDGPSGYKLVWTGFVKHRATKKVFVFSEWKGAITYRTPTRELEDEWINDWMELLDLLCSDHCLHPYDGLVAGSVA